MACIDLQDKLKLNKNVKYIVSEFALAVERELEACEALVELTRESSNRVGNACTNSLLTHAKNCNLWKSQV